MKCPVHHVEMKKIDETVNALDGTDVFWVCDGIGKFPRKHIIKTEEWAGSINFYEVGEWKLLKEEGYKIELKANTAGNYVVMSYLDGKPTNYLVLTVDEMKQLSSLMKEAGF